MQLLIYILVSSGSLFYEADIHIIKKNKTKNNLWNERKLEHSRSPYKEFGHTFSGMLRGYRHTAVRSKLTNIT